MRMKLFLIFMLGVLSMGATTFNARGGFEYEADLKIYDSKKINAIKPSLLEHKDSKRLTYYLYGWIRLRDWPENPVTQIPRCDLKAWNDYFSVSLTIYDLGQEKAEILIPLGSTVNNKEFNLKIK